MRKRKLLAVLLTVLAITFLVKLGFWQLDRAEQKQALFDDFANNQQVQLSLNDFRGHFAELARYHPVQIRGEFDNDYLLLDNQVNAGQPGYHVIGLLHAQLSNEQQQVIMVNMGWVPWGQDRQQLPQLALPEGQVTVEGLYYLPELMQVWGASKHQIESATKPIRVQQLDAEAISLATQLPIQPFVVLLSESAEFGWPRQWQPQVMTPAKHRAYAFQWFSLAFACLLVFWFASRSKIIRTEE